ncbi:MAG: rod shape-determining protein MreC [Bacteroidales bacterium]
MRNLLNFLARYNSLILFLLLEGIALYLVVTGNDYHNTRILRGVRGITRNVEEDITNVRGYLRLRMINAELSYQNSYLQNELERLDSAIDTGFTFESDTIYRQNYKYTSSKLVNNSVNRQKNYFTINKGRNQGLGIDMAVVSPHGVAGIIVGCSENYSVAMSLLNLDFRLSSKIRSNGYYGSLTWDGKNPEYAVLTEIPQHVPVNVGDTIETTGFSAIFPEGVMVGTVSDYKPSGGDFYRISVKVSTDFRKLSWVSVIKNLGKAEQDSIEQKFR